MATPSIGKSFIKQLVYEELPLPRETSSKGKSLIKKEIPYKDEHDIKATGLTLVRDTSGKICFDAVSADRAV